MRIELNRGTTLPQNTRLGRADCRKKPQAVNRADLAQPPIGQIVAEASVDGLW
ncbi:hypothetical protein RBSWK_03467 [Rhodopirellula baltica SWK14]|uniref:Uncharacterized protein n=1 Tax=Rhodopirellula baltica SWK14 TaxID=993516 RepID=L7CHT7_RHOBT|nr:hypothetical protein RBSWK_03467 [Rhodopirellula baltica SWK14]